MAKFDPPFSTSGEVRYPSTDEVDNGFPCGPADRPLFNGMFHRVEAELGEVITHAGLTPTNEDLTQVRQAIDLMIATAIGNLPPEQQQPDLSGFITMLMARARLPIFPEVSNVDGRIVVTAPATGTVRLPGGVQFMHRGIFPITTDQTDFPTAASKTYHLRWNKDTGYALRDLADNTYNPGTLTESSSTFDTTYDDMLIARVVTNSSNVATITNLANKANLRARIDATGVPYLSGNNAWSCDYDVALNWARTPDFIALSSFVYATQVGTAKTEGGSNRVLSESYTRYRVLHSLLSDWDSQPAGFGNVLSRLTGGAAA